jgi:hypothetical protein
MYALNVSSVKLLRQTADHVVHEVTKFLGGVELGKGGYFRAYLLPRKPLPLFYDLVPLVESWVGGTANGANHGKYELVSIEKAFRVVEGVRDNLFSSYAVRRNTDEGWYGGAILINARVPEFGPEPSWIVLSISGLPELSGDETSMVLTAKRMPWEVELIELSRILHASKNEVGLRLLEESFRRN